MDWTEQFDGYCERTDFTYWSEPINAVTNVAFIIVAILMWQRTAGVPMARVLCAILFAIGVGSYLFHTHATVWAVTADVVPIGLFILVYFFAVNRDMVPLHWGWAGLITAGYIPYSALMVPILDQIPFLAISNFYWTVPILLVVYAGLLWRRTAIRNGFLTGAAILTVSISLRSVDETFCDQITFGTHFLWHMLNAVMLGWMIHVYTRHMLATGRAGR